VYNADIHLGLIVNDLITHHKAATMFTAKQKSCQTPNWYKGCHTLLTYQLSYGARHSSVDHITIDTITQTNNRRKMVKYIR
jgi:hypothetical protein